MMSRDGRLWTQDCFSPQNDVRPSFPKSDAFNKMMWKKNCSGSTMVPQENKVNKVKVIAWVVMVLYYSPVGCDFQGRRQAKRKSKARRLLSTLASQDLCWKFQLHLNSSLDLRKASNSANAQLTVCRQRLLRRLLQSSSEFMLPKVLASLESQRPSGFVTWLWSNNFEIERSISRWITPLGIKTTFVSCAALFQWRRDACRSWKGISRSLWVFFSPPPPLHVHTFCASWLLPSLSATRPLVHSQRNCLEIRPCAFSMLSPCGRHWEQGTRGFTLAVDPLTRSSCRTEVSIPTSLLLPGALPAGDL